jgi:hypothetical protein
LVRRVSGFDDSNPDNQKSEAECRERKSEKQNESRRCLCHSWDLFLVRR